MQQLQHNKSPANVIQRECLHDMKYYTNTKKKQSDIKYHVSSNYKLTV